MYGTKKRILPGQLVKFEECTIGIALNLESNNMPIALNLESNNIDIILMDDGLLVDEGSI